MTNLKNIDSQIAKAKKELAQLYETKGYTDFEVLKTSEKVDRLINKRYKLLKEFVN